MNLPTSSAAPERFLGISAKSVHTLRPKVKRNRSNIVKTDDAGSDLFGASSKLNNKTMRYDLQRTAQSLMYNHEGGKQHRVCGCSRNVASDGVAVYRTVTGDNARYSNLMTCGSVWACPVCAAKVTEKRRAELQAGIGEWIKQGGYIALMTLTAPHESFTVLAEYLEQFALALKGFKNSRIYKNTFGTPGKPGAYRRAGSVRSLEVTHGVNGWHPHTHDLVFLKNDGLLNDYRAIEDLKQEWIKQCLKAGLGGNSRVTDMWEHGLDIRGGDYAAEYVAKFGSEPKLYQSWSAAHEVTKAHSKIGGGEHATPFMLLQWAKDGDGAAADLFKEFVRCFDGKRMNYWSPGLRDQLAIPDVDDETLAQEAENAEPDEELVIRLDVDQWKLVIETNARAEILAYAARMGRQGVLELLTDLETRPRTHKPWFMTHSRPDVSRFYH